MVVLVPMLKSRMEEKMGSEEFQTELVLGNTAPWWFSSVLSTFSKTERESYVMVYSDLRFSQLLREP